METIKKFITHIETQNIKRMIILLFAWVFIRIFIEGVLETSHFVGYIPFSYKSMVIYFIHYPAFYLSLLLLMIILTAIITRDEVKYITNLFSFGFGIIIFIPIIDWIINNGYTITYPTRILPYFYACFNPFVSLVEYGGSPGQRIVFFLICLFIGLYVFIKKRNILLSILAFFIQYFTIITVGSLPTILAGNYPERLYINGGILYSDTQKFASIFMLLLLLMIIIYLFLYNKQQWKMLIRSLRFEYTAFYGGVGIFGLLLALHQAEITGLHWFPFAFDRIGLIILWLSIFLGLEGMLGLCNYWNSKTQTGLSPQHPLHKEMNRKLYWGWIITMFCGALQFAMLISYVAFLFILSIIMLGILYTIPPIQIKRIPFLDTFWLAIITVFAMAMGYSIIAGGKVFQKMPATILVVTVISITLGFQIKNLKTSEKHRGNAFSMLIAPRDNTPRQIRIPFALLISASFLPFVFLMPDLALGAIVCALATMVYTLFAKILKKWFYLLTLYVFCIYFVIMLNRLPVLV